MAARKRQRLTTGLRRALSPFARPYAAILHALDSIRANVAAGPGDSRARARDEEAMQEGVTECKRYAFYSREFRRKFPIDALSSARSPGSQIVLIYCPDAKLRERSFHFNRIDPRRD